MQATQVKHVVDFLKFKKFKNIVTQLPVNLEENLIKLCKNYKFSCHKNIQQINDLTHHIENRQICVENIDYKNQIKEKIEADKDFNKNKILTYLRKSNYNWKSLKLDKNELLLYFAGRLGQNYAVLYKIFLELNKLRPHFKPVSLLDFGSGTNSVSWAAHTIWDTTTKLHYCIENNMGFVELAEEMFKEGYNPFYNLLHRQNLPSIENKYNLVVLAHTLFDIPQKISRQLVLKELLSRTNKYLVLAEHGTTHGFELILEAREYILKLNERLKGNSRDTISNKRSPMSHIKEISILAPCPQRFTCPRKSSILKSSPCAFGVRYYPPAIVQPYRNEAQFEPYVYIVFEIETHQTNPQTDDSFSPEYCDTRQIENNYSRVVAPVLIRPRHAHCRTCNPDGSISDTVFTKYTHGSQSYQTSKALKLGDMVDLSSLSQGHKETID